MRILFVLTLFLTSCAQMSRAPSSALLTGLVVNGSPTFNPALVMVAKAKSTLDIEIYEMEDLAFLEAIRAAVTRGVVVRIVKDPYPVPKGDQCTWFPGLREADPTWAADPKAGDQTNEHAMASCRAAALPMIAEIRAAKGMVVPFYKPHLCGQDEKPDADGSYCYEHGKIIIADGTSALVSTGNFNADNFCDLPGNPRVCNRDFSYVTHDLSQISLLSTIFSGDLAEARYSLHALVNPLTSAAPTVTASPYSLAPLVAFLKSNANGPGHVVQIENQYLKEKNLNAAIQEIARAGAHVEVMVASLCSFGKPLDTAKDAEQTLYQGFRDAGVEFKYFPAGIKVHENKGYLHAKAIVIDGKKAWVGSVNGSNSALSTNREFGLFFEDEASVKLMARTLADDFRDASAESFDESWSCAKD
jgi:phosphatidylserine/phosphatidylglycerophosphate/cardiolipin synthase-like enzyme